MPQPLPHTPSGIFICYRRLDCSGHAGRLFDRLGQHFGSDQVFKDVESLEPGDDFEEVVEKAVGSYAILIAMIGCDWLSLGEEKSWRNNPKDFVRAEIGTALRGKGRVIPVLVQGASMPTADQLPEDLAKFAGKHSITLSDQNWSGDVERLISHLEKVLGRRQSKKADTVSANVEDDSNDGLSRNIRRTVQITVGLLLAAALMTLILTQAVWKQEANNNRNVSPTPSPSIRPEDLTVEEAVERARQLWDAKKYAETEPYWRVAVNHDQYNAEYNNGLGVALYFKGKYSEAEPFFRQAVAGNSKDVQYQAGLGNVLSKQAKYAEAEGAHREAVRLSPNPNIHFINELGRDLYFQGKYREAESWFRKALAIGPNDSEIRNNLGNALFDQKKYAEAKTHYQKALDLQEDNATFKNNVKKAEDALATAPAK